MDYLNLKQNISKWVASHQEEIEKGLITLLQIPSVYDETSVTPKNPYGKPITDALTAIEKTSLNKQINTVKDENGQYV